MCGEFGGADRGCGYFVVVVNVDRVVVAMAVDLAVGDDVVVLGDNALFVDVVALREHTTRKTACYCEQYYCGSAHSLFHHLSVER